MSKSETRLPRISRGIQHKLMRLLYMEYKPSEIAHELGVTVKTIYDSYIPAGLPFRKDQNGNLWIVGTVCRDWANTVLQKGQRYAHQRNKKPLAEDQAYCITCRSVRTISKVTYKRKLSSNRIMIYAVCSVCGNTMTIVRKDKT